MKKIFCILISGVMSCSIGITSYAKVDTYVESSEEIIYIQQNMKNTYYEIPVEASLYVLNSFSDLLNAVAEFKSGFSMINSENIFNLSLGKPYVIYDMDVSIQDEIYYYPILDDKGNIVLTLSLMGTTKGWNISVSEELVSELNEIEYDLEDYIVYESCGQINFESSNEVIVLEDYEKIDSDFDNMSFRKKCKAVNDRIDCFEKTDIDEILAEESEVLDKYTRSFSTNTSTQKVCSLYNAKGQGGYGNCWAAATATIINYMNGSNVTAVQVCDKMGIGYDEGGSVAQAQIALLTYGVDYNLNNSASNLMSWTSVKTNINNKYPVYVSARSSSGSGHAVTVYGYRQDTNTWYVQIWNSGLNSGAGGYQILVFNANGTSFSYANKTYVWKYSCSYYM